MPYSYRWSELAFDTIWTAGIISGCLVKLLASLDSCQKPRQYNARRSENLQNFHLTSNIGRKPQHIKSTKYICFQKNFGSSYWPINMSSAARWITLWRQYFLKRHRRVTVLNVNFFICIIWRWYKVCCCAVRCCVCEHVNVYNRIS